MKMYKLRDIYFQHEDHTVLKALFC